MRVSVAIIFAAGTALIVLAGCNRNPAETPASPQAPAATTPAAPQPQAPPPIPPSTELPVNSVDSVMLSRPQDEPKAIIIHVSGTALSPGWTGAKLAEEPDGGADNSVKTYKFVATSPDMPDASRTAQPIEAEIRVDSLAPDIKTIRIVSSTNEVSAPIAQ
jgi:glucose/arabinose dehydrogenase